MQSLDDYDEVSIEPTTDHTLPALSHSMLNSIATCPTKGIITYVKNRIAPHAGRAMPLDAGRAAHETYAAARLWQMQHRQGLTAHANHHGVRLFGEDRYESMVAAMQDGSDERNMMLRYCLEAFYTCGFYDDPKDTRRTFVNIEEALIAYLDRYDMRYDVWVSDEGMPEAPIGIEIPFDVTVSFKLEGLVMYAIRFIGTADGLHWDDKHDVLTLEDNKTASRLGEGWAMGWHTSHQVTGYNMALSCVLGIPIDRTRIRGMCIPLPRSYDAGGLMVETVHTKPSQMRDFLQWLLHLSQVVQQFEDDPLNAPKNTGACYNYFRVCSLLPLCASDTEDRQQFYDEMVERDMSPTERALDAERND